MDDSQPTVPLHSEHVAVQKVVAVNASRPKHSPSTASSDLEDYLAASTASGFQYTEADTLALGPSSTLSASELTTDQLDFSFEQIHDRRDPNFGVSVDHHHDADKIQTTTLMTEDEHESFEIHRRHYGARSVMVEDFYADHSKLDDDDHEHNDDVNTTFHATHGTSFNSLSQAHDELVCLSEGLQIKARMLAERENEIAKEKLFLEQAHQELDDRRAILAQREAAMDQRLKEEERMMRQDAELVQQRLRDSVQEELASAKDKLHSQRETITHKLQSAQKLARQRAKQLSNAEDRIKMLSEKNHRLETRTGDLELDLARQSNELDRLRAELENAKKKFRVESWRRQKTQSRREEEAASAEARRASETEQARAKSSQEFAQDRHMLMLLIDGLAEVLLAAPMTSNSSASSFKVTEPAEDLFAHKLLPGLSHALHLLIAETQSETSSNKNHKPLQANVRHGGAGANTIKREFSSAQARRTRMLSLAMFCLQRVSSAENSKVNESQRDVEADKTRAGILHRFATRFLKAISLPPLEYYDRPADGEPEVLTSVVVLSMHMLKKPLEPSALLVPLRILSHAATFPETCELLLQYPVALEAPLRVLYFTGHAAWRPCVRESVRFLLAVSQKGTYQAKLLHRLTHAVNFVDACDAVLTTLQKLETYETDHAFADCACEAASIVSVLLQRSTRTESGVDFVRNLFRHCDLIGILRECQSVASALETRTTESDTLEFFRLNARAIETSLKARMQQLESFSASESFASDSHSEP